MQVHDYFKTGSDTNTTLRDNREAFQRLRIVPRVMVNVANIDLKYELLGTVPCLTCTDGIQKKMIHTSTGVLGVCGTSLVSPGWLVLSIIVQKFVYTLCFECHAGVLPA